MINDFKFDRKKAMKTKKQPSKESQTADSKPDILAKIMYEGIVRCIKAKNARNGEKKAIFELDLKRKRRVNAFNK
jgi:hypothetical protein